MTAIIESHSSPVGADIATYAGDLGLIGLQLGSYEITRHNLTRLKKKAPRVEIPANTVVYVDYGSDFARLSYEGHTVDDGVLVDLLHAARAVTLKDTTIRIMDQTGQGLSVSIDDSVSGWMIENFFHSHGNEMTLAELHDSPQHRVLFGADPIGDSPQPIAQLPHEQVVFQYEAV